MRIGVLGGTFDPPHYGHLVLAEQARDQLALERVLWVPAADPPHKQGVPISQVAHRVAMLRLALGDNPGFAISLADVERPGPHYSIDMLDHLQGEYRDATMYFMIGADSLRDLATWHRPARLIEQAILAVMHRPGATTDLHALEASIPGIGERIVFLDTPHIDISGHDIRARIAAERTVRYLLPDSVIRYVREHRLYAEPVTE